MSEPWNNKASLVYVKKLARAGEKASKFAFMKLRTETSKIELVQFVDIWIKKLEKLRIDLLKEKS
jgi:hypothetical protein|tara:strand:- start:1059 stop:1253 length:195 start_codon:yes stop_codon:yes gene_type:complete